MRDYKKSGLATSYFLIELITDSLVSLGIIFLKNYASVQIATVLILELLKLAFIIVVRPMKRKSLSFNLAVNQVAISTFLGFGFLLTFFEKNKTLSYLLMIFSLIVVGVDFLLALGVFLYNLVIVVKDKLKKGFNSKKVKE